MPESKNLIFNMLHVIFYKIQFPKFRDIILSIPVLFILLLLEFIFTFTVSQLKIVYTLHFREIVLVCS